MSAAALRQAADWLRRADGLLVTAGAGMGIDSGLPDFRGPGGFWAVYPALGRARIAFESIANPAAFVDHPALAWGFYGHRLALYRATRPHAGFALLRDWGARLPQGVRAFTSNVDGQFQAAGFAPDTVCEAHGSIHHLQCLNSCRDALWPADAFLPDVDADACRLRNDPPACPHCGGPARPNILMFGDWGWIERRTAAQYAALETWRASVDRLVVVEIGAGRAIPTVRHYSERAGGHLIRINPGEPEVPDATRGVGLALGGLAGLMALADALG